MSLSQRVINFSDLQTPRQIEERIHLPILDHRPQKNILELYYGLNHMLMSQLHDIII